MVPLGVPLLGKLGLVDQSAAVLQFPEPAIHSAVVSAWRWVEMRPRVLMALVRTIERRLAQRFTVCDMALPPEMLMLDCP